MKKILSLLVMLIAFCAVSFAQSAPKAAKTASKAMLLPNGAKVKNQKTGQVRIAKGAVPFKPVNGKVTIVRSNASPSTNSKQSKNNVPVKRLPNNVKMIKKLEQQ